MLEEILVRRLNSFLQKYKIINPNQFGFQKGKNINKLLGNFANHINTCLGENLHCLALFIDFSKAFDTLSHSNLLVILERNGIRGNALLWFKNYLELRTYRVKIGQALSNEINSYNGVPQGSKLGPILYLIYANEMLNILKNCSTFAYADDTAKVVSGKNINVAIVNMQMQLNEIAKWCHDNGLVINASKTKLMHIKPSHLSYTQINIKFHDYQCLHKTQITQNSDLCTTTIEVVKAYKYLGVYVDENFKWLTHIQHLSKKLRSAAYSLYHLSNCATFDVLRQAYFSLVESYLRHGITAWGSSTYCRSLQQTQNQILKILLRNKNRRQQQPETVYPNNINMRNNENNNTQATSNNNVVRSNDPSNVANNNNHVNTNNTIANIQNLNSSTGTANTNTNNVNANADNAPNVYAHNLPSNNITHCNITNTILIDNNHFQNTTSANPNYIAPTNNNNIASALHILNIKSIYRVTLINEFFNDHRFLIPIDHAYNTRRRAKGRYKVERHKNNFGKYSLPTALPNIFNDLPINLLQTFNTYKRKLMLKKYFIAIQKQ